MPSESVRITCSTEDLDAKLSKSMKLLGAHHDQYGRLVNAEGKFIAGLSQARIKMGDWIDSLGRARDANGGFLDGLSATELKLRYYKDEIGNVYDAEGNLIRVSDELAKAQRERLAAAEQEAARAAAEAAKRQEDLATAGQRGMQSLLSGAKGAAKMANNLSLMISVLGGGNEGLTKLGQNVVIATQTFSQFALAMKTLPKFIQGFKLLAQATEGQTAAQVILNAVTGNWAVLIAGGLAAGTLAYKTLSASTKEVAEKTVDAAKQVDALTIAYQRLGQSRGLEAGAAAGAIAAGMNEIDMLRQMGKEVNELAQKRENAAKKYLENEKKIREFESKDTSSFRQGMEETGVIRKAGEFKQAYKDAETLKIDLDATAKPLQDATDQYARAIQDLVAKDLPRDEMQELKERAALYAEALQGAHIGEEARANLQAALAENQRKQIELVQKQNQEAERAAKEEAEKEAAEAAKKLADAENALGDKFNQYASGYALLSAEEKAAADLNSTIETWRANFEAAGRTQEELDAAVGNLTKEYEQKRLQEFLDRNNLKVKQDEKLSAEEEYTDTLRKIKQAEEEYGLQAAEAEKLRAQAAEDYADALRKKAEEEEKQKESRLNELGITSLRESMKSPFQKMLEQQAKVAQAAKEGLISAAESQQLQAKLAADYIKENGGEEGAADETGFDREEYKRASTLTAGSNELYQAMTQRETSTERYQEGVTKTLANMDRYTEENNSLLQSIQTDLGGVMKAVGVL